MVLIHSKMRKSNHVKEELVLEKERQLWREFWIQKNGYYPTIIAKVARKVTFEEDNKEREALNKEFQEFANNKKDRE